MASLIKYEELIGFYDKGFVDLKQIRHIKKAGKGISFRANKGKILIGNYLNDQLAK